MWQLYRESQRELISGSRALQIFNTFGDTGAVAAAQVTATFYTVPDDAVLIINACSLTLTPGAGQSVVWASIAKLTRTGQGVGFFAAQNVALAAGTTSEHAAFTEVFCEPGSRLAVTGQFSAGGVANRAVCDIHGILIPKGNFDLPP